MGTVILDVHSYLRVKTSVRPIGGLGPIVPNIDKIPFNASIIGTVILFLYVVLSMTLQNIFTNHDPLTKFYVVMISSTLINMIRNPLIGNYDFIIFSFYYFKRKTTIYSHIVY